MSATSARTPPAGAMPAPAHGQARRPPDVCTDQVLQPVVGAVGTVAPTIPSGTNTVR